MKVAKKNMPTYVKKFFIIRLFAYSAVVTIQTDSIKLELERLKNLLYDKMDEYTEIAKGITNDLNIVDKEVSFVSSISK